MQASISVLAWVNGVAFGLLAVAAIRGWVRHRDRHRAALVLAIVPLGGAAVLGRVAALLDHPPGLMVLSVISFQLSGWGLIMFRHSVIPYSARARRLALTALVISGVATTAAMYPSRPDDFGGAQFASAVVLIVVWSACVAEPALRFWREARGRMLVQRRRLRALSLAFLGISLILLTAVVVHPDPRMVRFRVLTQVFVLLMAPMMAAALVPPAWLRRRWRRYEHEGMRAAIEQMAEATDVRVVGAEGLGWALRLLGSDTGFLCVDGRVLAARGLFEHDVELLAHQLHTPGIHPVPSLDGTFAIVTTLEAGERRGVLAVMAGPFSPVFGQDELDALRDLGTSIARAIERVHLLQAIGQESRRYEALLLAISELGEGVAISKDGKVVFCNDALSEMTGYPRERLKGMSWGDLIAPDDQQHVADQLVRLFTDEPGSQYWSSGVVRADGHRREFEGSAKLFEIDGETHILAIARDVTERVRATERDLRKTEQLDALAHASQRLASFREVEQLMQGLAQAATEVAACETAVVCLLQPGQAALWFGHDGPCEPPAGSTGLLEVLLAEHRPVRTSHVVGSTSTSGRVREVLAVPVVRAKHMTGAIILSGPRTDRFDDIDEAVAVSLATYAAEVVESLRALTRERAMIRRLKELDEIKNSFLAAVSHELRTPLTSVLGFAHTLRRSGDRLPETERTKLIERLTVNAEKLEALLADLLDLDRLNRGIIEPVMRTTDLGALVLRAAETFEFPDARLVHVEVEPLEATVDAPKVERILENLMSNAIRHTTQRTPIWVRLCRDGHGVLLAVEDAGPGVPEHLRARIFEPFQQGERTDHSPGVGIGLSLVSRFAALHGGKAWVTDRHGGGASFRVWLPLGARDRQPVPAS